MKQAQIIEALREIDDNQLFEVLQTAGKRMRSRMDKMRGELIAERTARTANAPVTTRIHASGADLMTPLHPSIALNTQVESLTKEFIMRHRATTEQFSNHMALLKGQKVSTVSVANHILNSFILLPVSALD